MNSYDSDRLLESVRSTHEQVKTPENADVIVFNTCHIREKAAEKIYSELGKIKKINKIFRNENKNYLNITFYQSDPYILLQLF